MILNFPRQCRRNVKLKLEEYVIDRSKVAGENKKLIQQIQGLLDLQTTVPEKAILKIVSEEVAALRATPDFLFMHLGTTDRDGEEGI